MQYYQSSHERINQLLKVQPALWYLIVINVAVWLLLALVQLAGFLAHAPGTGGEGTLLANSLEWISVPALVAKLITKPWTVVSYMFVHVEFWHIFFNMLWLYWFGKIFLQFMNGRNLMALYLAGGIAGAFTFVAAYNLFPVFSSSVADASAIGASASVLAITIGTAVLVPDYSVNLLFVGQVKIKYIAIFTVILDVLMIRQGNAGGHFAHLGGALAGLIYMLLHKQMKIDQLFSVQFLSTLKSIFRRKRIRKAYQSQRPLTDEEYNARKVLNQKKMDKILDKISRSGYASLSAEEKDFLFNSSKKD